jgi:hypothetical protein
MLVMTVLYTHKVLKQLSKVDVFVVDIAVFLSFTNLMDPANR